MWFRKNDAKKDEVMRVVDIKKDEKILLTAHGIRKKEFEYKEVYLTSTDVIIATFVKDDLDHIEKIKKIPRNDIYEIQISVLDEGQHYFVDIKFKQNNKNHARGLIFEPENFEEFEQILSEVKEEIKNIVTSNILTSNQYCWYKDDALMSHIASYDDVKRATSEADSAAKYGWVTSGTSTTEGHINIGRTFASMKMFGELALLAGGSRTAGKVTVSYVRSPEWLASRNKTAVPIQTVDDPLQKMKQLKEMLDSGLINESEYNVKKADLLSKM